MFMNAAGSSDVFESIARFGFYNGRLVRFG